MKIQKPGGKNIDMYQSDINKNLKVGIVILTDEDIFKEFVLILDEDNCLWYTERCMDGIKANQLVGFRKGLNNKAVDLEILSEHLRYGGIIPNKEVMGIPCDELYIIKGDYDSISYSHWGVYQQFNIIAIHYKYNESTIMNRYFITDEKHRTYRELSGAFASFYDFDLEWKRIGSTYFPIDIDVASSIRSLVKNFNPYEVFESYRVEIDYYHQSRVGRDDYYFEYKKYSIKYIDEYLSRWFKNEKIKLNTQSGYTSNFEPSVPYERFYGEELDAKRKAYAEYSKLEHYDCLMKSLYDSVQKHLLEIKSGKVKYTKSIWLPDDPDEMEVKNVYYWIYETISKPLSNYYYIRPSFNQTQKERYEEIIIDSISRYNKIGLEELGYDTNM